MRNVERKLSMDKKYFFFDIDGTLTDDATHQIVPSAKQTLHQLQANGHFVSIATGRAHYKAISFTKQIDIHNVVCNGGGCLVMHDKIIDFQPLPRIPAIQILEQADRNHIGWLIATEDNDSVWMKDYRFLETAGLRKELTTYHYDPTFDYHTLPRIVKMYLAYTKSMENQLSWINQLGRLRMSKDYVVYQYDAKKDGIIRMMQFLNAPLEDVVVFGDDVNDLVMFDKKWTSIAMGNAKEELKQKANYITARNVDDGIAKACQHFGWI